MVRLVRVRRPNTKTKTILSHSRKGATKRKLESAHVDQSTLNTVSVKHMGMMGLMGLVAGLLWPVC